MPVPINSTPDSMSAALSELLVAWSKVDELQLTGQQILAEAKGFNVSRFLHGTLQQDEHAIGYIQCAAMFLELVAQGRMPFHLAYIVTRKFPACLYQNGRPEHEFALELIDKIEEPERRAHILAVVTFLDDKLDSAREGLPQHSQLALSAYAGAKVSKGVIHEAFDRLRIWYSPGSEEQIFADFIVSAVLNNETRFQHIIKTSASRDDPAAAFQASLVNWFWEYYQNTLP